MSRLPSPNSISKRFRAWLGFWWPFVFLLLYILVASCYRSMGWGLRTSYREVAWSFSEPLPQGGEQRLVVQVHVPQHLFMPLPRFDSPPIQGVTFDFGVDNLQRPYTLTARLEPDWMWQWVDEAGKRSEAEWSFDRGREPPATETLYLKPVAELQGGERIRLDVALEPMMSNHQGGTIELVVEGAYQAIIRRFLFLFCGEFATFLGIIIFLTGSLWQYSQSKKREIIQQKQKELQDIIELSYKNLVDAIEKIVYLDKNEWNKTLQSFYQDIVRQIKTQSWELAFIYDFEKLLLKQKITRFNELLNIIVSFQTILKYETEINQKSEKQIISEKKMNNVTQINNTEYANMINWEIVTKLYYNPQNIDLSTLKNIIKTIWEKFDIEAREIVVELLMRFINHNKEKEEEIKNFLEETHNIRRIGHHFRIRKIFNELTNILRYEWLYHPIQVPNLSQNIRQWLGDRDVVFYPGCAEMESKETIERCYYFPARLKWLIEEPKGTVWIQMEKGGGRTALGLYLAYQAWERRFFPVRLTWNLAHQEGNGPIAPVLMTAMAQAAAGEWLKVLPNHPAALLDLPSFQQREVMSFLLWALGHRDALSTVLEEGRYTPMSRDQQTEKGEEWQRQMRVLQNRLQHFLPDEPISSSPTPLQLREWLGLRPAGLEGTCVIMELQQPIGANTQEVSAELLGLAAELAQEGVALRVIAWHAPGSFFPAIPLRWTKEELKAMLIARDADRLFAPSALPQALDRLAEASDGLPRKMMILGQLAITAHLERESQNPYLDEEDVEEAIERYNRLFP
ncbi:MAG: hypothetical protein RMN24_04015 [Anaerolineae bacterium]|nr:hypothetical protein [Anaerolineae bacterium]